ncbi:MAG: tRNA (adenosine(37)-N6)-threonylcarbamoyltransferase complex transferase subunit TsaD [Brevinema sp.]
MLILGIESSCDECAIALVKDGKTIIRQEIFSQTKLHEPFSGVVPEIASRNHLITILPILERVLGDTSWDEIDAIASSTGPGLIGSLVIGTMTARSLAFALNKPFIPVDHIEAHLYTPHLEHEIPFPHIALVCSGGHTLLVLVKSHTEREILGTTIDDAIGECFDKVAKMLSLGYPGGPIIQQNAEGGDENFWKLPLGLADKPADRYHFSYSGLKTAVYYRIRELSPPYPVADICASFQKAAVLSLLKKLKNVLNDTQIKTIITVGGVAANKRLRQELDTLQKSKYQIFHTPLSLCGDNAAMVAGRAFIDYKNNKHLSHSTHCYARLPVITKGKRL